MLKKLLSDAPGENLYNGLWSRTNINTGVTDNRYITFDSYIGTKNGSNYDIGINVSGSWALQIYLHVILYDSDKTKLEDIELWRIRQGTTGTYTIENESAKYMRFYIYSSYQLLTDTVNVVPSEGSYIRG